MPTGEGGGGSGNTLSDYSCTESVTVPRGGGPWGVPKDGRGIIGCTRCTASLMIMSDMSHSQRLVLKSGVGGKVHSLLYTGCRNSSRFFKRVFLWVCMRAPSMFKRGHLGKVLSYVWHFPWFRWSPWGLHVFHMRALSVSEVTWHQGRFPGGVHIFV